MITGDPPVANPEEITRGQISVLGRLEVSVEGDPLLSLNWDGIHYATGFARFTAEPGDFLDIRAFRPEDQCGSLSMIWLQSGGGGCRVAIVDGFPHTGCDGSPTSPYIHTTHNLPSIPGPCDAGGLTAGMNVPAYRLDVGERFTLDLWMTNNFTSNDPGGGTLTGRIIVNPLDHGIPQTFSLDGNSGEGKLAALVNGPSPGSYRYIYPGETEHIPYEFIALRKGTGDFETGLLGVNARIGLFDAVAHAQSDPVEVGGGIVVQTILEPATPEVGDLLRVTLRTTNTNDRVSFTEVFMNAPPDNQQDVDESEGEIAAVTLLSEPPEKLALGPGQHHDFIYEYEAAAAGLVQFYPSLTAKVADYWGGLPFEGTPVIVEITSTLETTFALRPRIYILDETFTPSLLVVNHGLGTHELIPNMQIYPDDSIELQTLETPGTAMIGPAGEATFPWAFKGLQEGYATLLAFVDARDLDTGEIVRLYGEPANVEILSGGVIAFLEANPDEVLVEDPFTVILTVRNETGEDLTQLTPPSSLTIVDGEEIAYLSEGPASPALPIPTGQRVSLTYTYQSVEPGSMTMEGFVEAETKSGESFREFAEGVEVTVRPPFDIVKITTDEPDDQIVPGDHLALQVELEKFTDEAAEDLIVLIDDDKDGVLENAGAATDFEVPAGKGRFTVLVEARVQDHEHPDIMNQVIRDNQEISLEEEVDLLLIWRDSDSSEQQLELNGSLEKDGGYWNITYPDLSLLTDDPPPDPADSAELQAQKLEYYKKGSYFNSIPVPRVYLEDPVVRKWALAGIRYGDACPRMSLKECTPDDVGTAVDNLAQFFIDKIPFLWTGDSLDADSLADTLESGNPVPPHACIGMANALGAFARVVGVRARETNNALQFFKLIGGERWAQHATVQLWFDGEWQWYDIAFAKNNGNRPIKNDGFPEFYFGQRFITFPYKRIRTWYGTTTDLFIRGDITLVGQGDAGEAQVGELLYPANWQAYSEYAAQGDTFIRVATFSPVRTLYVDSQGRRLGAVGPLTQADYFTKDKVAPVEGEGSVWEVPGGFYVPEGTPVAQNTTDPTSVYPLEEQILVPLAELTDQFSLLLTGTGEGPYALVIWMVDATGEELVLLDRSGSISEGQVVAMHLMVDLSGEVPLVSELAGDMDGDGIPDEEDGCPDDPGKALPGACGCGTPDIDADNDGTADCSDACPSDPIKIEPGICGCGLPDTDSDDDGSADCLDECDDDPNKVVPGECGCGVPEGECGSVCEDPGDFDQDCDIDRDDLTHLLSFRNRPADAAPECDLDGDGFITVLDARRLVLMCTRPRCATD